MKSAAIAIAAALFAVTTGLAQSSNDSVRDRFAEGHAAREKHQFEDAERSYLRAYDYAAHLSNPEAEFQAAFYLGLTKQEAADEALAAGDSDRAKTFRQEAEEFYKKAHELKPRSTATILNLAEVVLDTVGRDAAKSWLERGLGIDDERAPQFAEKLGDLEAAGKEPKEALRSYRLALKKKNVSTSLPHKYLTQLLLVAKEPNDKYTTEAVDQLWGLVQSGEIDSAIDGAFAALQNESAFGGQAGVEMLNIVAAALAEKEYDAAALDASKTAAELRKLSANEALAPRIAALFSLYKGTATSQQVSVWLTPNDHDRPPARPSGIESLQNITRGLAFAAQRARDYPRAEAAYSLALRLDPQRLDPGTLRDLATVYYAQGKLAALENLLREFEERLYEAKGAAYERVDWNEVYEYHRTVAMLYLWTGRHADANTQFDFAYQALSRLGVPVDPELRLAHAEANFALGAHEPAMRERLQAAEEYVRGGDLIRARGAISLIDPAEVQSDDDLRLYRTVLDAAVQIGEPLEHLYEVKSALALLSTDPEKTSRAGAEKLLAQWGVTNVRVEKERGTFAYDKRAVPFEVPAEPHP